MTKGAGGWNVIPAEILSVLCRTYLLKISNVDISRSDYTFMSCHFHATGGGAVDGVENLVRQLPTTRLLFKLH